MQIPNNLGDGLSNIEQMKDLLNADVADHVALRQCLVDIKAAAALDGDTNIAAVTIPDLTLEASER
jgi:hypothetical protein